MISYAKLDGSDGGGQLNHTAATLEGPYDLARGGAPQPAPTLRVPEISGQQIVERPLYCSRGAWDVHLPGAFLYQAPRHPYAYSWLHNGEAIAGATESSYRPTKPGTYDCQVTAANFAGSTTTRRAPT